MSEQIPEPMESQLRKASEARHILPQVSFLGAALGALVLDALVVAGGWVTGSPSRMAMSLLIMDCSAPRTLGHCHSDPALAGPLTVLTAL